MNGTVFKNQTKPVIADQGLVSWVESVGDVVDGQHLRNWCVVTKPGYL